MSQVRLLADRFQDEKSALLVARHEDKVHVSWSAGTGVISVEYNPKDLPQFSMQTHETIRDYVENEVNENEWIKENIQIHQIPLDILDDILS